MTAAGWQDGPAADDRHRVLLHRGFALQFLTLAWDVVGCVVLLLAVIDTRSVALGAFGLHSLVDIGAGTVVVWELSGGSARRRVRALRLIGWLSGVLALYLTVQSTIALAVGHRAVHGLLGVGWTAVTALVMLGLAVGTSRTGRELADRVLVAEGRRTSDDAVLAAVVVLGICLDTLAGWWWADALVGYVAAAYAAREFRRSLRA